MSESQRPTMSDAEREVMKVLWENGPSTVRQVLALLQNKGQDWARTTVTTLLQRLETKGYVASDKSHFAYKFSATASKEDVMRSRMSDLASEFSEENALPLLMAFTEQHAFTADEIAKFRQMIEQLSPKRTKRGRK